MTPDGVGELHDFMPVINGAATDRHRLVRQLRVVRGTMRFAMDIQPAFDYARGSHKVEMSENGAMFEADGMELTLHWARPPDSSPRDPQDRIEQHNDGVRATRTLREGESAGLVLESMGGRPRLMKPEEIERLEHETADFWRAWVHKSTYTGRWREMVTRSAITLKLMIYKPTGAPVAAPTTGLPSRPAASRNWDYRYTWVRDGFVLGVLGAARPGAHVEEAPGLRGLAARPGRESGRERQRSSAEDHVPGSTATSDLVRRGPSITSRAGAAPRPVRIGNGAADQLQLDIYGELLDRRVPGRRVNGLPGGTARAGSQVARMVNWLCDNWDKPDEGIWETRGGQRDFTYGRFQSWVAFDRAIKIAEPPSQAGPGAVGPESADAGAQASRS